MRFDKERGSAREEGTAGRRPRRPFGGDREERPRRSFGGDREERPRRSFSGDREERPRRSFSGDREDRPRRSFGGDRENRPRRPFGGDREERPRRPFGGDREERPRRPFGGDREDRPRRPFGGDREGRPRRPFGGDREERPRRSFGGDREDRPRRPFGGDREERPRRPFGGDREDRPRRPFGGDREDRPRRSFGGYREDRPRRPFTGRGRGRMVQEEENFRPVPEFRKPKGEKPVAKQPMDPDAIRLNKYIANSGVCSRREADEYIQAGVVTVNGEVVTELGVRVHEGDDIRFNGERLKGEKKVYIVMNKPKDFVTTTSDPHAEKNVMDLISTELCPERVFPVGRLDKSTTGVLLFTNDGALTEKLTHPSYERKKIYQVVLTSNLKKSDFDRILEGITLDDGPIAADALSYLEEKEDHIGIEIHSGRNRIVRRIFESLGYQVKRLDRVYFAGLTKKNLNRGQWRFLNDKEVAMLMMGSYE